MDDVLPVVSSMSHIIVLLHLYGRSSIISSFLFVYHIWPSYVPSFPGTLFCPRLLCEVFKSLSLPMKGCLDSYHRTTYPIVVEVPDFPTILNLYFLYLPFGFDKDRQSVTLFSYFHPLSDTCIFSSTFDISRAVV